MIGTAKPRLVLSVLTVTDDGDRQAEVGAYRQMMATARPRLVLTATDDGDRQAEVGASRRPKRLPPQSSRGERTGPESYASREEVDQLGFPSVVVIAYQHFDFNAMGLLENKRAN